MQSLDRAVKIISCLTVAALLAVALLRHSCGLKLPTGVEHWLMPVLTAAAVGYLTNWIAIWLLFKPYEKHGVFPQGVIPRNQAKMARELSVIIPEYLLKPDELAEQLGHLVRDYLQNPELLADIRAKINIFLKKYSSDIAAFLLPYIEDAIHRAIRENLTPDQLRTLYDHIAGQWLATPANRRLLAGGIVTILQNRAPELTAAIRANVRTGAGDYMRTEYPNLSGWLNADAFAAKFVDYLNWERIQSQVAEKLGAPATAELIAAELAGATVRLREWLQTPAASEGLAAFIAENQSRAEAFIQEYLAAAIPGMVDRWLHQEQLWSAVENQILPLVKTFILNRLKHEKNAIISQLDLSGKIEQSVRAMDVTKLHEMIHRASGEHLTAIQLLGYLLGAAAGVLLVLAG